MDDNEPKSGISLCDAIDRILNKGVVAHGDLVISVADVDLIRISLRALVAAADAVADESLSNVERPAASRVSHD